MGIIPNINVTQATYNFSINTVEFKSGEGPDTGDLVLHCHIMDEGQFKGTKVRTLFRYTGEGRDKKTSMKLGALTTQVGLVMELVFKDGESAGDAYVNWLCEALPGASFISEAKTYKGAPYGEEVVMNLCFIDPNAK